MENPHGRWFGSLDLGFECAGTETVMRRSRHVGPLRVQRPFREADGGCQVYILNPPGGTVGGDELRVYADLQPGARALLTAPGAAKFYRSAGPEARALQHFQVASGARLEWLPQESIVYDGANARVCTRVELQAGARFAGWEVTCLGRPAAGERFERGRWSQRFELFLGERPLWLERMALSGSDEALDAPWGLAGRTAFGSFVVHPVTVDALDVARSFRAEAEVDGIWLAATLLEHAPLCDLDAPLCDLDAPGPAASPAQNPAGVVNTLVVRFAGASASRGREVFAKMWTALRPLELGSAAEPPRIWAT